MSSEPVISFFNKGKSISLGLPFLQFCKKYDICTWNWNALTFGFGKKSVYKAKNWENGVQNSHIYSPFVSGWKRPDCQSTKASNVELTAGKISEERPG